MKDEHAHKKALGRRIATFRKEQGTSQAKLGKRLLELQTTISKWENGITAVPISKVAGLAEALGVTVEELLDIDPTPLTPHGELAILR